MSDTSDLAKRLGAALGDGYAVERALGEGGFAVVFLVRDLALKRNLAVKVLSPDMIASHTVLERFRREAETVAQLSHPNIVPLHFIGDKDGLLYLAMQCVDGGSIADRIKSEGRLPADDAMRIIAEVAMALAHAHKRGVIHRDIKPANVLVDPETGRCLVTDFGIARSVEAAGEKLTATGIVLGTPTYLAPEQITGEPVDHRADLFALGVMAYEMLAGRPPYDSGSPTAAMMKRLAGPPEPITELRADVPAAFADVIAGCLATDPAQRIQSAADVVRALTGSAATSGARVPAHPVAPPQHSRRAFWMGAAGAAVVLVSGAWWGAHSISSRGNAPTSSTAPAAAAMVAIRAGDYVIGSDSGPALARPRHTVRVAAFRLARTEVTVGQYRRFVEATRAPAPWGTTMPDTLLPVTRVPWGDAANFCAWSYPPNGRLPSEEEWEVAARGASGRAYPYGARAEAANANTASANRGGPVPVGSFPRGATPEGLEDMSGNVWEWTSSPLAAYPGGLALPDSMRQFRVIRGGAYDTPDSFATAWMRGYVKATAAADQLDKTGFRCAQ